MQYNSFVIHLVIGTLFLYIGYYQKIMVLIVLGILSIAYHVHLMFLEYTQIPFQPPVSNHSLPFQNQQTNPEFEQAIQLNALQRI